MIALLALPWVRAVIGAVVAISVLASAYAYIRHEAYKRGSSDMKSAVEAQDARAVKTADAAKLSVDQCFDAGREWSQMKGVCGE